MSEKLDLHKTVMQVTQRDLFTYPEVDLKSTALRMVKSLAAKKVQIRPNRFFWPNGLLACSQEWHHRIYDDVHSLDALSKYLDRWIKSGMKITSIDEAINGYPMIYLYELTGDAKYEKALHYIYNYLNKYIARYSGDLPYRSFAPKAVLVDCIGLVRPFLSRYGALFNNQDAQQYAIDVIVKFTERGIDDDSFLPYHGYLTDAREKLGIIGWGRAVGWFLIGMVDSLEYIHRDSKHYDYLVEWLFKVVDSTTKRQRSDGSYSWHLQSPDSYADSSSTSMISYAIMRGIKMQVLPKNLYKHVIAAIIYLERITKDGRVQECSAECRGIGIYPQIYGNYPWAQAPASALFSIADTYNENLE